MYACAGGMAAYMEDLVRNEQVDATTYVWD